MAENQQLDGDALFAAFGQEDADLLALARQPQLLPRFAAALLSVTRGDNAAAARKISGLSRNAAERLRVNVSVLKVDRRARIVYGLSLDATNATPPLKGLRLRTQYGHAANELIRGFLASDEISVSISNRKSGWIFEIPGNVSWPKNLEGQNVLNVTLSHFLEDAGIGNPQELNAHVKNGIVKLDKLPLPVFQALHFTLAAREAIFDRLRIQHDENQSWLPSLTQMAKTAAEIKQALGRWPQSYTMSDEDRARRSDAMRKRRKSAGFQEAATAGLRTKLVEYPDYRKAKSEMSRVNARKMNATEGVVERRTATRMERRGKKTTPIEPTC